MKKTLTVIGIIIILIPAFTIGTAAFSESGAEDKYLQEFFDTVPDGIECPEDEDELLSGVGFDSLIAELMGAVKLGTGSAVSLFVMLFGVAVIIAISEAAPPFESASLNKHTAAGISVISAVLIFGKIAPMCFSVREGLEELCAFFSALIPVLTGIMTAGGNISTAAAQSFNMNVTLAAVSYVSTEMLLPLAFALFSFSC